MSPIVPSLDAEPPFVSVVVPVFNQSTVLTKCLQALEEQKYSQDRYEVVVVDNGSSSSVEPLVRRYPHARAAFESRPGSYAARNTGVSLAHGQILAFTDADCLPAPDWIERGVAALRANPACGLVGGAIEVFHAGPRPTWVELWDCTRGLQQKRYVQSGGYAATANAFTFKHVFDAVGPFDAAMKSSGDVEWGRRAGAKGYRAIYAPDAHVRHPARATFGQVGRKMLRLAGGKHDLRRHPHAQPREVNPWIRDFLGELIEILFHDPRLPTAGARIKVASVVVFIESVKGCERLRLRIGGTPRR